MCVALHRRTRHVVQLAAAAAAAVRRDVGRGHAEGLGGAGGDVRDGGTVVRTLFGVLFGVLFTEFLHDMYASY
ncbi:hypothetical protein [Streptomyces sp.]|uniref:hypothetical protein n=1 Tax=Streptomyces sp. TaxID=1931 RepID=UPI002B78681A|nr:hypothetical protein [Streptomyces sp.]HLL37910.1 hypothetical protein [Streptomyces sp.]HZF92790.1 hypothetical protein [Streptomyces sp.]